MIIRRRVTRNFTIISNELFDDERLSLEAMGLLAWLRSRPDNWALSVEHLRRRFQIGRNKIHNLVRELVGTGWVTRERQRNPVTKAFIGIEYVVLDEASSTTTQGQTPGHENGDVACDELKEPRPDLPDAALPEVANQDDIIRTESEQELHTPFPSDPPSARSLAEGDRWRALANEWNWEPGESRTQAETAFKRLSPVDQRHALAVAGEYIASRARAGRKRNYLKSFLRERLFVDFTISHDGAAGLRTGGNNVFVAVGTDEFDAWDRAYRTAGKPGMPQHSRHAGRDGWWRPSRFPAADWRPE
ncbi:putative protein OS=Bosea thiooxidans OX=53254 GN=SAMN05660750_03258 PE=4 SV=1 [Bosea thiooxidans]|uniref:Uncharacterized protein n=1 Tax=Bosea thiooxidans TaxID=53254 RepID=A0A1T5FJI8_9HYPH|nr:MarR family transcriptional regulator [Bosea thiooxidans]SKB96268.1 hypothetical protein SAMN05660750_03258 [Bosea thiooxidans]